MNRRLFLASLVAAGIAPAVPLLAKIGTLTPQQLFGANFTGDLVMLRRVSWVSGAPLDDPTYEALRTFLAKANSVDPLRNSTWTVWIEPHVTDWRSGVWFGLASTPPT